MLLVVPMVERELLPAVGRIVERVDVERDAGRESFGRLPTREAFDARVDGKVDEPLQRGGVDGVLEPRERGLAGEVAVVERSAGDELEDIPGAGSLRRSS